MIILKELDSDRMDASTHLINFRRETSGLFYAIYGDDTYAVPIVGWGINKRDGCAAIPLVLHARFGLVPAWAALCNGNNFTHISTRNDQ